MKKKAIKNWAITAGILICIAVFLGYLAETSGSDAASIDPESEIKIGLVAPLSGSNSTSGLSMQRGVELTIDTINKAGGVDGYYLSLCCYDDGSSPALSLKCVKSLIYLDGVDAIIGPFGSDACLEAAPLIDVCQFPLIAPTPMASQVGDNSESILLTALDTGSIFSKIYNNSFSQQKSYVLLDGLGAKTIGILWQNDIWGQEIQQRVAEDLKNFHKESALLFNKPFYPGNEDFSSCFDMDVFPDLIYVVASGDEAIDLVKAGREAGFTGLFLGEGGFNSTNFDQQLGEYADGCLYFTQWHPSFSTPMSDVFISLFTHEYQETPDMTAAMSYEAIFILKTSLQQVLPYARLDDFSARLHEDLISDRKTSGMTGVISFSRFGQCDRPLFLLQKRWDGKQIQPFIIYPTNYAQDSVQWTFDPM